MVYPHRKLLPAKVKAFADFMVDEAGRAVADRGRGLGCHAPSHDTDAALQYYRKSSYHLRTFTIGAAAMSSMNLIATSPRQSLGAGLAEGIDGWVAIVRSRQQGGAPSLIGDWTTERNGEPCLEELMEDPMMGLIWRRDGLEPPRARQTVLELKDIVRARRESGC